MYSMYLNHWLSESATGRMTSMIAYFLLPWLELEMVVRIHHGAYLKFPEGNSKLSKGVTHGV